MYLCFCLLNILQIDENIHLGSLSSYPLEHLFGNIKTKTNDNTHKRFLKNLENAVLKQNLVRVLEIERPPKNRVSSSGAHVKPEPLTFLHEFSLLILLAASLFTKNDLPLPPHF